jgi:hypothetical protein
MNKNKQRVPIKSQEVFEDIKSSDAYIEGEERGEPLTLRFGRAAHELALLETYDSGHRSKVGDQLAVAGLVEQFASASERLSKTTRGTDPTMIAQLKAELIPFNHAVKTLIDNDPGASFAEVQDFILDVYETTHRGDLARLPVHLRRNKIDNFNTEITRTLSGMRHEIGANQLFNELGYDVDNEVTTDDELHGIDMFITSPDGKTHGVDVKSNPKLVDEARAKDLRNKSIIVWSCLNHSDFDGTFRLAPETVALRAPDMRAELDSELRRTGR